jgi:hypothetical protein
VLLQQLCIGLRPRLPCVGVLLQQLCVGHGPIAG